MHFGWARCFCTSTSSPLEVIIYLLSDESCLWRACVDHDCGENGNCIPLNQSSFKCQCKLYYDGTRCDVCEFLIVCTVLFIRCCFQHTRAVKPIERAAMFDGTAFLEISSDEFPHLTSEKDEVVEFKFKTRESDGVFVKRCTNPAWILNIFCRCYFGKDNSQVHPSSGKTTFQWVCQTDIFNSRRCIDLLRQSIPCITLAVSVCFTSLQLLLEKI